MKIANSAIPSGVNANVGLVLLLDDDVWPLGVVAVDCFESTRWISEPISRMSGFVTILLIFTRQVTRCNCKYSIGTLGFIAVICGTD